MYTPGDDEENTPLPRAMRVAHQSKVTPKPSLSETLSRLGPRQLKLQLAPSDEKLACGHTAKEAEFVYRGLHPSKRQEIEQKGQVFNVAKSRGALLRCGLCRAPALSVQEATTPASA